MIRYALTKTGDFGSRYRCFVKFVEAQYCVISFRVGFPLVRYLCWMSIALDMEYVAATDNCVTSVTCWTEQRLV